MRGHVRKRGNKWAIVLDIGPDPETGKRRQRWHSGFERRRDAERELADLLSKRQRDEYVEPSTLALGAFLTNQWLPSIRASVREGTFESYARNIRAHLVPRLGEVQVQALTPARLNSFYADLLTDGRNDGNGCALGPDRPLRPHDPAARAGRRCPLASRDAQCRGPGDPPTPKAAQPKTMATWTAQPTKPTGRDYTALHEWLLEHPEPPRNG